MESRNFFEQYQPTNIETDPLPLKVLRNTIAKNEIPGQAVHWGFDYLDQRQCPLPLINNLLEKLYHEVTDADFLECVETASEDGVDGGGPSYEPLKLMRAVVKKLDDICLKEKEDYHDSVDGTVDSPDLLPHVHAVSYYNIKNSRRYMEDRMTILPRMDRLFKLNTPVSYFAVFDGHNGAEAAAYSAAQLHQLLIQSINQDRDVFESISDAFENLDAIFVEKCKSNDKIKSGSTVVLSMIMPGKLYVAWLGDSQAVLVKKNETTNLVVPHKPERKDEIDRIRSLGGEVIQISDTYRVNGNLAVSRAIGDVDQKTFVISTPDIKMLELDGSEEFLILACDGLWDEISPESAANIVRRQVVSDPNKVSGISQKLIQQAKQKGSSDNISVIVVFLEPIESIKNRYEGALEPEIENEVAIVKPEPIGVVSMEKFIEHGIETIGELNGHAKEGDQMIDFLSFGSSGESGGKMIDDDMGNNSGDDLVKKEVEDVLSDAESDDDEWQFEKPALNAVDNRGGLSASPGEPLAFDNGVENHHHGVDLLGGSTPDVLNAHDSTVIGENGAGTQIFDTNQQTLNPFSNFSEIPQNMNDFANLGSSPIPQEEVRTETLLGVEEPTVSAAVENFAAEPVHENVLENNQGIDLAGNATPDFLNHQEPVAEPAHETIAAEPIHDNVVVEPVHGSNIFAESPFENKFENNQEVDFLGGGSVSDVLHPQDSAVVVPEPVPASNQDQLNPFSNFSEIPQNMNDFANLGSSPVPQEEVLAETRLGAEEPTVSAVVDNFAAEPVLENNQGINLAGNATPDFLNHQEPVAEPAHETIAAEPVYENNILAESPFENKFENNQEVDFLGGGSTSDVLHPQNSAVVVPEPVFESNQEQLNPFSNFSESSSSNAVEGFANIDNNVTSPSPILQEEVRAENLIGGAVEPLASAPVEENVVEKSVFETNSQEPMNPFSDFAEKKPNVVEEVAKVDNLTSAITQEEVPAEPAVVKTEATNDTDVKPAAPELPITEQIQMDAPPAPVVEPVAKPKTPTQAGTKPIKSPTKSDAAPKGKPATSTLAAKKTAAKPGEAAPKAPGLLNGKPATVPKGPAKPAPGATAKSAPATKSAPSTARPTATPRTAPSRPAAAPRTVNGTDKTTTTTAGAKTGPSTMRTRPATAPTAPRTAPPKPASANSTGSSNTTTSPKRAPPTTSARTTTARPATASTVSKVGGDAAPKPAPGLTRAPRPKPTTTTTTRTATTGVGAEAKKAPLPRTTAPGAKAPAPATARPAPSRPLPSSARTAPPAKPATTTAARPTALRNGAKPPGDTSKPATTTTNRLAAKTTAPSAAKAPVGGPRKVESSTLKGKKPAPTTVGKLDTSKTLKSTINKKVAESSNEKSELIRQNGVGTNEASESLKELNAVNGGMSNGDVHDIINGDGETEKQDAIKENGVHLDDEQAQGVSNIPEIAPESVPVGDLLA